MGHSIWIDLYIKFSLEQCRQKDKRYFKIGSDMTVGDTTNHMNDILLNSA